MRRVCADGNRLISKFSLGEAQMTISDFLPIDDLRRRLYDVSSKIEPKWCEKLDELQRKFNDLRVELKRQCAVRQTLLTQCEEIVRGPLSC
jgi:hypothetical protein